MPLHLTFDSGCKLIRLPPNVQSSPSDLPWATEIYPGKQRMKVLEGLNELQPNGF